MGKILLTLCLVLQVSTSFAFAQSSLILNGTPLVKAMCDISGCETAEMSPSEQANYKVLILKRGEKYVWASRDNKELAISQSGVFKNFIASDASGYIRISATDGQTLYVEHLILGFKNITYWGVAEDFILK